MEYFILISKIVTTVVYGFSLLLLCTFGIHRYYLSYLYSKNKNKVPVPKGTFEKLPVVTVQLPVYNEMYVVERLISRVCNIDYPKELLEIQVLDDSTDKTTEIARCCVSHFKEKGFNITCLHRKDREGYKAGALREGLKSAKGELIAIFDADFMPPKNFLRRTVDFFVDSKVGMVQVRWGHVNQDYSTLTKAQSILLDGHFILEQSARFNNGMFFNFNGTAGVIRKKCTESSGGWQHDTLTEKYQRDVQEALTDLGIEMEFDYSPPLFDHPLFIEDSADRVQDCLDEIPTEEYPETMILFTAHSIPMPMAEASPYVEQLTTTARLIAEKLNYDNWRLVYQSRSGRPTDPWLEPDVCDVIEEISKEGVKNIIAQPIGFICDHIEVLFDIGVEAQETSEKVGINLLRAKTVNDDPKFIEAVADVVQQMMDSE